MTTTGGDKTVTDTALEPLPEPGHPYPLDSRGLFPRQESTPLPGYGPCEACGEMVPPLPAFPVPELYYERAPYFFCPASDAKKCDERKAAKETAERAAQAAPKPAVVAALKTAPAPGDDAA